MAGYNGNSVYLDIDGTRVDAYFKTVTITPSVDSVDITAGSSVTHKERAAGLKDDAISITVQYDTAAVATILPLITPGEHVVTYGPEGNGTGKPKHVQSFIFTEAPHTVAVTKDEVVYAVKGDGAAAPTVDMYAGGVWS